MLNNTVAVIDPTENKVKMSLQPGFKISGQNQTLIVGFFKFFPFLVLNNSIVSVVQKSWLFITFIYGRDTSRGGRGSFCGFALFFVFVLLGAVLFHFMMISSLRMGITFPQNWPICPI